MTCSTPGQRARATSAADFSGTTSPRLQAASWVTTTLASASSIRSASASEENPPNTTEWTAPIRAQASIVIGSSGIIPM